MPNVYIDTSNWTHSIQELAALLARRSTRPLSALLTSLEQEKERVLIAEDISDATANDLALWIIKLQLKATVEGIKHKTPTPQKVSKSAWGSVLGELLDDSSTKNIEPKKTSTSQEITPQNTPIVSELPVATLHLQENTQPSFGSNFKKEIETDLLSSRSKNALQQRKRHNPMLATGLSLLAPGAGQAYNGEPHRGLYFSLLSFFVIPWFLSIFDAWKRASRIQKGDLIMAQRRKTKTIVAFLVLFWLAVISIFVARSLLLDLNSSPEIASSQNVDQVENTTQIEAEPVEETLEETLAAEPEVSPETRRRMALPLIEAARSACARGEQREGLRLLDQALIIDEENRLAREVEASCSQRD